jgi:hypothetical protein
MKLQAAKKGSSIILLTFLVASVFLTLLPQSDGALTKPSVPEFSVKLTTHVFDVPASSSTDQFTGQTTTIPGIHHEYQTIDLIIKNQPFTPYVAENTNGNTLNLVYNIRYKGPYAENWTLLYGDVNYQIQNYTSPNTLVSLALTDDFGTYGLKVLNIPKNTTTVVDFQVQALIGTWHRVPVMFGGFRFEGEAGDWSGTQAVSIDGASSNVQTPTVVPTQAPKASPTATSTSTSYPTQSETQRDSVRGFDWQSVVIAVLAVLVIVLVFAMVLQRKNRTHLKEVS